MASASKAKMKKPKAGVAKAKAAWLSARHRISQRRKYQAKIWRCRKLKSVSSKAKSMALMK